MKHLLFISVASPGAMFANNLKSLLDSNYTGDILVLEDGIIEERMHENTCKELGVNYIKYDKPSGPGSTMYEDVKIRSCDYDIVTHAHADVKFPNIWFSYLDDAWNDLIKYDKIYSINLNVTHVYNNFTTVDGSKRYSLGWDTWNDNIEGIRQVGRMSPVRSYPFKYFKDSKYEKPEEAEIHHINCLLYEINNRLWSLWLYAPDIYHYTMAVPHDSRVFNFIVNNVNKSYEICKHRTGVDLDCTYFHWYSDILVLHRDEIINAFNKYKFDDIDYIFDEFYKNWGNCDKCRLYSMCTRSKIQRRV